MGEVEEDRLKLVSDINLTLNGCILVLQGWSSLYSKGYYVSKKDRTYLKEIRDVITSLLNSITEIDKKMIHEDDKEGESESDRYDLYK